MAKTLVLAGSINDICAKLAKEEQTCKGVSLAEWLELREHEERVARWIEQGRKDEY